MINLAILTPKSRQIAITRLVPPLDGLCEMDGFSSAQKEHILAQRNQTDQRKLRQAIYKYVDAIFRLPNTVPGMNEDVSLTLEQPGQFLKIEEVPVILIFEATIPLKQHFQLRHYATPTFGDGAISCTVPTERSPGLSQLTSHSWHGIMLHNN